jgi:hypothetical protein
VDQDLPKRLKRFLQRELELKGVHILQLNNDSSQAIELLFPWAQRYEMTRGNLRLSYDDRRENLISIPLRGYPAPIRKTSETISFEKLNEAPYPEKILQPPKEEEKSVSTP